MEFVHLHINTEYSLLNSAAKIHTLVKRAKELQFSALAITDQNVMYGIIPFYKECKSLGIKPIIGLELSIVGETNIETRLILLAKTFKGYQNLLKLSSIAQILPSSSDKIVEKKYLFKHSEDLIAISSPYKGEIQLLVTNGLIDLARTKIKEYTNYFGQDFFIGIQDHFLAEEKELNMQLLNFSKESGIDLVVTNQVMYVQQEDALAHQCLLAIHEGSTLKELNNKFESQHYYLKSKQEMYELFPHIPEALLNSQKIADRCNVEINLGNQSLPKFPLPETVNAKLFLRDLCFQGLKNRYEKTTEKLVDRLNYELKIIDEMNFNDYFLIVWDFMTFAHEREMIVGPGRGSAAGSLVAYVLNITDVDPIKFDLLFERFLNPERISMPDIDIDFPDTRREEVIQYVFDKYGKNHVAQIITFGTLAAKAALRDIGKVVSIPSHKIDFVAKQIPSKPNITIDEALNENPSLRKQLNSDEEIKNWFQLAKSVEGLPRHASTHAAGIVISEHPLTDLVPLQPGHYDVLLTQYPMNILEELGLLKMDFLGLRNLSFIEEILNHIVRIQGKKIKLQKIPLDDEKTFQLLSKGDTTGVFQLESPGMRRVLAHLKPTEFEDLVAVNALYRPGPMENIPLYIAGKHKKRQVSYIHRDLVPIVEKTYGVIIYQEQIMQIASKLAGFSLGEADILRRAVSKKKLETLEGERGKFVKGCLYRGYNEKVANDVYDLIVRFANYGFNRSHSVAYSIIAYQLAYLKANYPTAFFAALLTSAIGIQQKVKQYIADAKQKKIEIRKPSINDSDAAFTISKDLTINFGLAAIKNVGMKAIEEIVTERNNHGDYTDIFQFCARMSGKHLQRRILESLVLAGCFDEFGHHRAGLLATLDDALEYGERVRQMNTDVQTFLFKEEIIKPSLVQVPPFKEDEKLHFEQEVLGFYLSSHPIERFSEILKSYGRIQIKDVFFVDQRKKVRLGGLIESKRVVKTKKGEQMAFIKLSDESSEIDITIFPKTYRENMSIIKEGSLLFLEGKLDISTERTQLIADKLTDVKTLKMKVSSSSSLYLKIGKNHTTNELLFKLKNIFKKYSGQIKVILFYEEKRRYVELSEEYRVSGSKECIQALCNILGKENVVKKIN